MILQVTSQGVPLNDVYDLPLDVFYMYADAAQQREARQRMQYVTDTSAAIAGALGGKAAKEHFDNLLKQYEGGGDG